MHNQIKNLLKTEKYESLYLLIEYYITTKREKLKNRELEIIGLKNLREIQVFALISQISKSTEIDDKIVRLEKLKKWISDHNISTKYTPWISNFDKKLQSDYKLIHHEKIKQEIKDYSSENNFRDLAIRLIQLPKENPLRQSYERKITFQLRREFKVAEKSLAEHPELLEIALKHLLECRPFLAKDVWQSFIIQSKKLLNSDAGLTDEIQQNILDILEPIPNFDSVIGIPEIKPFSAIDVPYDLIAELNLSSFDLSPEQSIDFINERYRSDIASTLDEILVEVQKKKSIFRQIKDLLFT